MLALVSRTVRFGAFLGGVLLASTAWAGELVVVDAVGADLKPGATVDGAKPLRLNAGARITLVASTGAVIKLRGPSEQVPQSDTAAAGSGMVDSLRQLVTNR